MVNWISQMPSEFAMFAPAPMPPVRFIHQTTLGQSWRGGRVVYCGGLENRFGFTADGGSNPSLSANFRSRQIG